MRIRNVALCTLIVCGSLFAQTNATYTIYTVAGGGLPDGIVGTSASLGIVSGVAADSAGNVYIALQTSQAVLRLDPEGVLTRFAGTGVIGSSGDGGPATSARLSFQVSIAADSIGNVYIADYINHRIRKVSNGIITTIAGGGLTLGDGGPATSAMLYVPSGVAVDSAGDLYVADSGNNRIRKVSNGIITTVAGTGSSGFSGDGGLATSAQICPVSVATDKTGNIYIADCSNRIREVSGGIITTIAGDGIAGDTGDGGPALDARIRSSFDGIAVDGSGRVYVTDNQRVRRIANGIITTVAGGGHGGSCGDAGGPALGASFALPGSIAAGPGGELYIADDGFGFSNGCVRRVLNGAITTIAGGGPAIGDGGPATKGQLFTPIAVALDAAGKLYIADKDNDRVRSVANGTIDTVTGNGSPLFPDIGDGGLAVNATVIQPTQVAVDSAGALYVVTATGIRKVSGGIISSVAKASGSGLAVDNAGNLYVTAGNVVSRITNGSLVRIAGNGTAGYTGDNGAAENAQLSSPRGLAIDSKGDLYIADAYNYVVRKVSNGIITTVAGPFYFPTSVAVDGDGSIYVGDAYWVRKVTDGVISTIAGGGYSDHDREPAVDAQLGAIAGVAVDVAGNVYIADANNNRIRVLRPQRRPASRR